MLIVGLGNPGIEYENTRHNAGFLVLDEIAKQYDLTWKTSREQRSIISTGIVVNTKLILAKPQTFMNLSGSAVSSLMQYYKMVPKDVIVMHDDLEIPSGVVKYKFGGGAGGHNGLRSIDQNIGNNYHRIRIGIGRPDAKFPVENYVLSKFTEEEKKSIYIVFKKINENILYLMNGEIESFQKNITITRY
jgi:PTH1 family peptidyl-tRNA hydrolase